MQRCRLEMIQTAGPSFDSGFRLHGANLLYFLLYSCLHRFELQVTSGNSIKSNTALKGCKILRGRSVTRVAQTYLMTTSFTNLEYRTVCETGSWVKCQFMRALQQTHSNVWRVGATSRDRTGVQRSVSSTSSSQGKPTVCSVNRLGCVTLANGSAGRES